MSFNIQSQPFTFSKPSFGFITILRYGDYYTLVLDNYKAMQTTTELNIPINRKGYKLIAGRTTRILLPSPFKISDSIIKIECDHQIGIAIGKFKIELSYKEPNPIRISNSFNITSPTYIAFSELTHETDYFLNNEEFHTLEITSTIDIPIVLVFENKLPVERMHYFRNLFLSHAV